MRKDRANTPKHAHKKAKKPPKQAAVDQPPEANTTSIKTEEQEEDCITDMPQEEKEDTAQIPLETAQKTNSDLATGGPDGKTRKPNDTPNEMRHRGVDIQTQTDLVMLATKATQTDFNETAVQAQEQTEPSTAAVAVSEGKESSPPEREQKHQDSLKKDGDAKGKDRDKVSEREKKQETSEKDSDTALERTNVKDTSEKHDRDVEKMDTDEDTCLGSSTDPPEQGERKSYAQVLGSKEGCQTSRETQTKEPRCHISYTIFLPFLHFFYLGF